MVMESSGAVSIVDRVKAIILRPKDEWPVIAGESTPSGDIFTRYVIPLALIGPVCAFLGGQVFGYGAFGFSYRPSLMGGLSMAIGAFVFSLIGLLILSVIAGKLAPQFGGEDSSRNGFKLVAYALTASWVVGIFTLIPALGFLRILGLYSVYVFYVGAGPMLKVPAERVMSYTVVTVLCAILLNLAVGMLAVTAGRMFGGGMMGGWGGPTHHADGGGTMTLPGGVTIDTDKMQHAAQEMQEAVRTGKTKSVAPSDLQALLPTSIGSYARTATESAAAGPMGSHAEGTYVSGDKRFRLNIVDMSALGAMANIGTALGIEQNKEDANGYERMTTKDGHLTVEKWDRSDSRGKYGTMVGQRFMIEAEGQAGSIDELKAAVTSVDPVKLAALAK